MAENIGRSLLRAIRGRRSQEAFARRLSIAKQTIANWETGRRRPSAARVLAAAQRAGVDVSKAFRDFEHTLPHAPTTDERMALWLRELVGRARIGELAKHMGCSRYQVSRWVSGETRIRLHQFLWLVHLCTKRLSDLVAGLVPIESIPSLAIEHRQRRAARTLAFDEPWTEAVVRMTETDAYRALPKHEPGWLADRLGFDRDTESRCLDALTEAGVLVRRRGRYVAGRPLTVDTSATVEQMAALKLQWLSETKRRVQTPAPHDMFGYMLISLSKADLDRIRELHLRYFREIRAIVGASEPTETVAVLGMQLFEYPAD